MRSSTKEKVTAARIRRLTGFTKKILLSKELPDDLPNHVRDTWMDKDDSLELKEIDSIANVLQGFRPYLESGVARSKFLVADYVPFVVLSNMILAALGKSTCKKALAPEGSSGSILALDVDASALYWIFGGRDSQTELYKEDGEVLTNVLDANARKSFTLGGVLDMPKVYDICRKYRLIAPERFVVLPNGVVRIVAEKKNPLESVYELRRQAHKDHPIQDPHDLHSKSDQHIENLLNKLEKQEEKIKEEERKVIESTEKAVYEKEILTQKGKDLRMAMHVVRRELARRKEAHTRAHKDKSKAKTSREAEDTKPAPTIPRSLPTLKYHGIEDNAEKIDLDTLRSECAVNNRQIAFTGTDYGICTLAVSARLDDPAPFKTCKTTAMHIHKHSRANKHARLREHRKHHRPDVLEQEALLARANSNQNYSTAGILEANEVILHFFYRFDLFMIFS